MSDSLDVVRRVLADPTNPDLVHELVSDESVCVSQGPRLLAPATASVDFSGRYKSADGWVGDRVWAAHTKGLEALLAGIAPIELAGRLTSAAEAVLALSDTTVTLTGPGCNVMRRPRRVSLQLDFPLAEKISKWELAISVLLRWEGDFTLE